MEGLANAAAVDDVVAYVVVDNDGSGPVAALDDDAAVVDDVNVFVGDEDVDDVRVVGSYKAFDVVVAAVVDERPELGRRAVAAVAAVACVAAAVEVVVVLMEADFD